MPTLVFVILYKKCIPYYVPFFVMYFPFKWYFY